jgi:hypothetical protein
LAVLEIRLQRSAILLIGRLGELPTTLIRAGDQLHLHAAISQLPCDRFAINDLRRQWHRVMPGISPATLSHIDMATQLKQMLRSRQLVAALLHDNGAEVRATKPEQRKQRVIRLPYRGGMLLVAPPGSLPGAGRTPQNNDAVAAILRNLAQSPEGLKPLEAGWSAVFGGAPRATGAALLQYLSRGLANGNVAAQVLAGPSGLATAARRPDAPRPVAKWSNSEKIAEAIPRSGKFLSGDLKAFVETFRDPMVAAKMAAGMAALLALQAVPVVGAAIDTAILLTLAWTIGWEAGKCIDALVHATIAAVDATDEAALDRAARLYANAFEAMGTAAVSALTARFMLRARAAATEAAAAKEANLSPSAGRPRSAPQPADTPRPAAAAAASRAAAFETKSNEATFWSGLGPNGAERAQAFVKGNGGKTLEQLTAERRIDMPVWDRHNPSSVKAWEDASRMFAQGAKGDVRAVLGDVTPGSVWSRVELPALKSNPAVTKIIGVDPVSGASRVLWP